MRRSNKRDLHYAALQSLMFTAGVMLSASLFMMFPVEPSAAALQPTVEVVEDAGPPAVLGPPVTLFREENIIPTYDLPIDAATQRYIYAMCEKYGIVDNYTLVLALIWRESNFDNSQVSATGDYGIMQINKNNFSWLQETLRLSDLLDEQQNIEAGVYVLSLYINKHVEPNLFLMAYKNGSAGAQRNYWSKGIYSQPYSDEIIAREQVILQDAYYENCNLLSLLK